MKGIYSIKNIKNDKIYVGRSNNIEKRIKRHYSELRTGKHHNILLQRSYNKNDEDTFKWSVLEEIIDYNDGIGIERENFYIEKYKSNIYNIGVAESGGDNISSHPNRDEIVKKISESMLERYKDVENRKKTGLSVKGELNGMYGKKHTEEVKLRISKLNKEYYKKNKNPFKDKRHTEENKKIFSENGKKRVGKLNGMYGKKHTKITKDKISKANKGRINEKDSLPVVIDGILYKSMVEASNKIGVSLGTISLRVNSTSLLHVNYYKYIEGMKVEVKDNRIQTPINYKMKGLYKVEDNYFTSKKEISDFKEIKLNTVSWRLQSDNFPDWEIII